MERNSSRTKDRDVPHRQKLCPTEGKTLKKNSLDDLFIFCSSKILFHMNVSVLRTSVCLLYYLCLSDEKYFLFFVVLSLCFPLKCGD